MQVIAAKRAADPAPADAPSTTESAEPRKPIPFVPRAVLLGLVPVCLVGVAGLPYYSLSPGERLWSDWHAWFKPSGYVGQAAGFVTLFLFLFLWLYPIRKKFASLSFTGSVGAWLNVHIIAGVLVPVVGAVHAAFRFQGLIGLGYFAMLLVALSGIVGRYLYTRIPRQRNGLELSREEMAALRRELVGEIVATTGLSSEAVLDLLNPSPRPQPNESTVRILARMVRDDFARRRAVRGFLREWRSSGSSGGNPDRRSLRRITSLARQEMALSQQIRMLEGTNRVFRYWHAAHKPFAITAFLAVLVHVVVVVALGSTWIR